MITGLQRFFAALHDAGVRISTAERIDALRAVEAVGPEDRRAVKSALRATLVKRAVHIPVFDETFDRYFFVRRGRGVSGAVPGKAGKAEKAGERLRRNLADLRDGRRERWGKLRNASIERPDLENRSRTGSEHISLRSLRRRPAADEHEAELATAVRRMIERIRLGSGRRYQAAKRGRPHPRRSFRESLRTGGVPFRIPLRRNRVRTPRVYLLIDVSWSTARAAGLFLQMVSEFLRLGRQTRVVLFVDRPVDATERVASWLERGRPGGFVELLEGVAGLNPSAPSDYGRTFHRLLVSPHRPRGRRTVLVVLGDGRSNNFAAQEWALDELTDGCGAALWLVPEPSASWGTGDSALASYLPSMDTIVEADDVDGLARGVSRLLRRL